MLEKRAARGPLHAEVDQETGDGALAVEDPDRRGLAALVIGRRRDAEVDAAAADR